MIEGTIDRIEEKVVVVELRNKKIVHMPRELVPKGAIEGDVIEIVINKEKAALRKKELQDRMKRLQKRP